MGIAELYMGGNSTTAAQRQASADRASSFGALLALALASVACLGLVIWGNQSAGAWDVAEKRISTAQAGMASLNSQAAEITARREAEAREAAAPRVALEELLGLVEASYRQPTDDKIKAVRERFSDSAEAIVLPEAMRLRDASLRLAGRSSFEMTLLSTQRETDKAWLRTREIWVYDERSGAGSSVRCIREETLQTYAIQRVGGVWQVDDLKLEDSSRSSC